MFSYKIKREETQAHILEAFRPTIESQLIRSASSLGTLARSAASLDHLV